MNETCYKNQQDLIADFERNKDSLIVLACDDKYFTYQLIQIENIISLLDIKDYEVVLLLGSDVSDEQCDIVAGIYPFIKQIKLRDIEYLQDIQKAYFNTYVGSDCVSSCYFGFLVAKYFKYTIYFDTDVFLVRNPLLNLDVLASDCDILSRNANLRKYTWVYDNYKKFINWGVIDQNESMADYFISNSGFFVLTKNLGLKVDSNKLKKELINLAEVCNRHYEKQSSDCALTYALKQFNCTFKDMPNSLHAYITDYAAYSGETVNEDKIGCMHFAGRYNKIWSRREYLRLYPTYMEYAKRVLVKIQNLKDHIHTAEQSVKILTWVVHEGSRSDLVSDTLRKSALLQLYQELVPTLIKSLADNQYFYMSDTLSEDRLILWSKQLPDYFRCDIAPYDCFYRVEQNNSLSRDRFLRMPISVVIKMALRLCNLEAGAFIESRHYQFLQNLRHDFPNTIFFYDENVAYVKIITNTGDFSKVLNRLTAFLTKNYDVYISL